MPLEGFPKIWPERPAQASSPPLSAQFRSIASELPADWRVAHLRLTVPDAADCGRAAALLGPANPGRHGKVIRFDTARGGAGVGPDRMLGLLRRLDAERIHGELEVVGLAESAAAPVAPRAATAVEPQAALVEAWDAAVATLPPDWSDLVAEVELTSSDYIEPGALRLSPLNPTRPDARPIFRFRAARRFGYGGSPEMVRRCFARLDEAGMRGELRILQVFSDTHPAKTQGPVWYAAGKVI
ncbi:MAG TPA: hypothetical protein VE757_03780 [Gaiellaceae bacterium]|nr:hypothetical protein [Gaiellaceae bacterium]